MSSRALRRAQKERERLELEVQQEQEEREQSDDGIDLPRSAAKPSAFALLGEAKDEKEHVDETGMTAAEDTQSTDDDGDQHEAAPLSDTPIPKSSSKRKKKKKKAKTTIVPASSSMDEIDLALKSLSASNDVGTTQSLPNAADQATIEVCQLLCIDTHHLQVANEMKRLFGRGAFDADREEQLPPATRQRLANREGATLAEAVAGKNSPGGAGLPAVIRRKNIFIPGKEEWPKATGGGLGMEVVARQPGGVVEYSFVHSRTYQDSQREFETCVQTMDPSTMVRLLRLNPYHVSALLQVSEIAKQEKDYATSGDLLERALFSFGRAVHSTFAANLAQGKARLDFRRPENREFWLACWRYVGNISMRATWRTAYEWARLLLSLDPERDPYCIGLIIDQFALRAKQPQTFLNLSRSKFFVKRWSVLPNIRLSQGLAANMADSNATEGRKLVAQAVEQFPWVGARLFQELGIDKIPKAMWGKTASTDLDILHCELYVTLAQDLWKLPETMSFLVLAASEIPAQTAPPRINERPISTNEARFVVLTDKPALIGLLPRSITSTIDSMADPLPPQDNLLSYESQAISNRRNILEDVLNRRQAEDLIRADPQGFIEELEALTRFFELVVPDFSQPTDGAGDGAIDVSTIEISEESVEQALARSNLSVQEMRACLGRLISLRTALGTEPERRVQSGGGDEATILDNGVVRTSLRTRDQRQVRHNMADDEALARQLMEEEFDGAGNGGRGEYQYGGGALE